MNGSTPSGRSRSVPSAAPAGRHVEIKRAALAKRIREGGIGIGGPYYAETASAKGDEGWPYWIVRNKHCNSLGVLIPGRAIAEAIAISMNEIEAEATP